MKLFQQDLGEWAQNLVPENVTDSQISEDAAQHVQTVMEQTVYAVLKALETEKTAQKPNPVALCYDVAAVLVTSVAAAIAALLSPWAALAAVAVIASAALALGKKLLPEKKAEPAVRVNEAELAEALKKAAASLAELLNRPEGEGEEEKQVYDIQSDRSFARWLQMFALYVRRNENSNLKKLYLQLKQDLENMGILIYDELEMDEDGRIRLPEEDSFMDLRTGESWTQVTLPIVYTKQRVLMHGQIK